MLKIIGKIAKGCLKGYLFMFTAPFVILFILFVLSLDATFTIVRKRK